MLDAGDIIARLKLDRTAFDRGMKESSQKARAAFGMTEKVARQTSKAMGQDIEKFAKKSVAASEKVRKGWWATFGKVAIGFTIAYRAMNVLEAGLRKYADTTRDAIRESGELAAIQAKLAFWYKMHSEDFISYNEAFARAEVNTRALMRANLTAISSLEELSTGLDEVAQSVGAIPARLIPALADVVDFTVMVAQTTGSTIRQVRQELQALMQGQVRTTNILIRALKNLRVLTEEDISNLKAMTNRAEIFEKVLMAISEHWSKVREKLISTDVVISMKFWEKSIRAVLTRSVQLASELENVGNIFAEEFAVRGRRAASVLKGDFGIAVERNIVLMQRLRDALALGLDLFEWFTKAAGYLATGLTNLAEPIKITAKALGGYLVLSAVNKLLKALGGIFLWLATGPMKVFLKVANAVYIRFLLIPAVIAAAAISVEVLLDMLDKRIPDVEKKTKDFLSGTADKTREATRGFIDLKGTVQLFTDAWTYWGEVLSKTPDAVTKQAKKASETLKELSKGTVDFAEAFGRRFAEKTKSHFDVLARLLEPLIEGMKKQFEDLFRPPPIPFDWEQYLPDAQEAGEGLGWAFRTGWDEATGDFLDKGMKEWFKAYEKLRKEVEKGIRASEKSINALVSKWVSVTRTAAEVALASMLEVRLLWESDLIDTETFERAIDEIVAKYKKATKEMEKDSTEFAEVTKTALSDIFVDAMMGRLKDFEDYWSAFCEGLARIFADTLIKMVEEWIKTQAKMRAAKLAEAGVTTGAGGLMAVAGPMLAGAAAAYTLYKLGESRRAKREAEAQREQRRVLELAARTREMYDQIFEMIRPMDEVTAAIKRVNDQFDGWIESISSLGAISDEVRRLEEKRAEALEKVWIALREEFAKPLEDIIARLTMAPREYELYGLKEWYDTQIDAARALGRESVELLRKAYEISKMQYILKQKELLLSQEAEFARIVERMGMTPLELQLEAIEDWRESIHEAWEDVQAEIDMWPSILEGYEAEIARLNALRSSLLRQVEEAGDYEAAWVAQARRTKALFESALGPGLTMSLSDLLAGKLIMPGGTTIVGEPAKTWEREFYEAYNRYRELVALIPSLIPVLESIPGEISDIEQAIIDKNKEIEELIEQLGEAGAAEAAAYLAQIQAVANEFIGGLLSIIRSHTWSEYEQGLYDLNQWYYDQLAVMEALGIQTDLLTQAYDLQRQALLETALDQSDLTDELDEWRNVLVRLRDQILSIQTSLANPLDILERMAILEGELARVLGESWRAGIISTEGMSAEMVERMSNLLGQYLDMAADAFQRPSIEYQSIYGSVLDALMQLEEYAEETVTDLEIQLEQLEAQLRMVQLLEEIVPGPIAAPPPPLPPIPVEPPTLGDELIGGTPIIPEISVPEFGMPELQEYVEREVSAGIEDAFDTLIELVQQSIPMPEKPTFLGRYQGGTDYVPRTGLYELHEGETVTPAGQGEMIVNIAINESATPQATATAVKDEFIRLLRTDVGRKEVQQASRGK